MSEGQPFPESWDALEAFVASFPDDATWRWWKAGVLPVLLRAREAGLAAHFHASQSMQHLIFSTTPRPDLGAEPRVTLARADGERFELAYGHANRWFTEPEATEVVSAAGLYPALARSLARLWAESCPGRPLPAGLPPRA